MTIVHRVLPAGLLLVAGCAATPDHSPNTTLAPSSAPPIAVATKRDPAGLWASVVEIDQVATQPLVVLSDDLGVVPVSIGALDPPAVQFEMAPALPPSQPLQVASTVPDYVPVSATSVPAQSIDIAALSRDHGLGDASGQSMAHLDALEGQGAAPRGSYGYVLMDAQSGRSLGERDADTALAPASVAKLLAAIAILEAKGPSGTLRTTALADGPVSGGVLRGDLHLVGSGDPSLNRSDLSAMARQIAAAGIRRVEGRFVYHGDALPQVSMIDANQPAGAVYNPGVSGLNLDYNEGRGGAPLRDPARETALAMRRAAAAMSVTLPVPVAGTGDANGTEVAAHDSPPISSLLTTMFDRSRNITAEALGAAAAADLSRKPSSLRDAARINADWAQSRIGPIGGSGWSGFDLANNSGLSTDSRATPRQIAALVRHGYREHGELFRSLFLRQSDGASNGVRFDVRAKIGTMSYVRGLSGILSLNGRDMIFAILATDPARSDGSAQAWMGKARQLEKALLSDWLQNNWPSVRTASR